MPNKPAVRWPKTIWVNRPRIEDLFSWIGLFCLTAVTAFAVPACWLLSHGIDSLRAQHFGGIAGTVRVARCDPPGEHFRGRGGWACDGEFISDDGSTRIAWVEIFPSLPEKPTEPVPVRVSGPSASKARPPSGVGWVAQIGGGAGFGGIALWIASALWSPPTESAAEMLARVRARADAQRRSRRKRRRRQ